MNQLQPPDDVLQQLEQLDAQESKPSRSLILCIETWDRLMDEIGAYPGSIADEYLNDLGSRTLASLWLTMAAEEGMTELLEWTLPILEKIDDRYRAKSRPDLEGLNWDANRLNPHYWWLRRLPEDEGLVAHFRTVGPDRRQARTSPPGTDGN